MDWGLGHATRCIPIIRYLLEKQCEVTVAAEGAAALLLRSNFPELSIVPIEGYKIRYSRSAGTFAFKILMQVPKIFKAIQNEKKWLAKVQQQYKFDLVISDNRYGLKIEGLPSVIMTHQLQIKSGAGAVIDGLLLNLHCQILEQFDQCWVVDHQHENSIGGELSHPQKIPSNARYIGLLSQLDADITRSTVKEGKVLVLLSGPEPQRGLLEYEILSRITSNSLYRYTVVGGNPGESVPDVLPLGIDYYTHLNAFQLQELMHSADLVICRSGYSTLMDLVVMEKKALLIPTPGQSEQEYLAANLSKQGLFFSTKQASLDLESDISEALKRPGFAEASGGLQHQKMKEAVDEILGKLQKF
ncbi:UDP-N-acetylglucosamine--N-acetylmuramyl-(pentapeptide) pyrophosphoryl-undecaprenol N-acetylglucosamine transferase [Dyadobacter frigoris]|uniref:UDP-N-acetylglucosamine--N-acetylmuramyl-(Pentapeptide) pyrophosphoryl-undecaprenol N-acetylglucosamine transferase n=1 Tax=Dyadobacter frigoris TaxID=2576211 RepID=A0A4U6D9X5_9BACT|nr:UDP-N-acetylglucosamine--N-acetylmuramyl-(pentapeptide) pyrophosphoryl-undecaprenol N-acetylglucosamine transferase [Dyadobacter frigoris]